MDSEILNIGLDDGHSETKIVMPDGKCFKFPSRVRAGRSESISIRAGSQSNRGYTTGEGDYFIPENESPDSTTFDEYPVSAMNRVMVAHAMLESGISAETKVRACSGLPLKRYYRRNSINEALVEKKVSNLLTNDVTLLDGQKTPEIVDHAVLSEGIAAWIDYVVDRKKSGLEINERRAEKRVGIIDIGGGTTEIAVVKNWDIDTSRSSTVNTGALLVEKIVSDYIQEDFDIKPGFDQIQDVLKSGVITIYGEVRDAKTIADEAMRDVVKRIENEVRANLNSGADLSEIIFVGGGAIYFEKYLADWFTHSRIAENPSFANARGMQKYIEISGE